MNILITGADGFIGRELTQRLLRDPQFADPGNNVTLVDVRFDRSVSAPHVRLVEGSIADKDVVAEAVDPPPDLVFHLACIASGQAEADFPLGLKVNVEGTLNLLEALRGQERCPRFVYSSSIAVFGGDLPETVTEDTCPAPTLSYGAQKVVGETLLMDYSRRGWLDGVAVRLPGVVARPPEPTGAASAFLSDLIRTLGEGLPYVCPVSASARTWLISRPSAVDNLLTAATLDVERTGRRIWTLPAVHVNIDELVAALAAQFGPNIKELITYRPDPALERNFGSYPPLETPMAEAAGFISDGDAATLVARAWEDLGSD